LIALIIRASTDRNAIPIVSNSFKTIHFAIKPISGGIPAKLATINKSRMFLIDLFSRSLTFFCFILFKISMITKTVTQYLKVYKKNRGVLMEIASSIHPRLNTDE